jgi:hypothetical protein
MAELLLVRDAILNTFAIFRDQITRSMKTFSKLHLFLLLSFLFAFSGCMKKEEFPVEPQIAFGSFVKIIDGSGIDNRGVLEISYTDGDGDIGLSQGDTLPPYDYNFFMKYYEKQNGVFKEVFITYFNEYTQMIDTLDMNARIPMLTPSGRNKAIKGIIQDTIFINNYDSPYDTIRFEVFIKDRALHESNTIITPEIFIKKQ